MHLSDILDRNFVWNCVQALYINLFSSKKYFENLSTSNDHTFFAKIQNKPIMGKRKIKRWKFVIINQQFILKNLMTRKSTKKFHSTLSRISKNKKKINQKSCCFDNN